MATKPRTKITASADTLADVRRYVSQQEAAERWGVHVDTIRRLIAAGRLTAYRLNGRIIRVSVAELDACFLPIPAR